MVTEQHSLCLRVSRDEPLDHQPDIEPRPLPRHIDDVVAVHLAAESFLIDRCGDGNDGVRMQMIDVLEWHEGVQRSVDRTRARVETEHAVLVHRVHRVFDRRFWALLRIAFVDVAHGANLVEIERREPVTPRRAQVAAGALHPQDLDVLPREGVALEQLRRRVPATGVRQRQVLAEFVRSIDQTIEAVESPRLVVVPQVSHVLKFSCRLRHITLVCSLSGAVSLGRNVRSRGLQDLHGTD